MQSNDLGHHGACPRGAMVDSSQPSVIAPLEQVQWWRGPHSNCISSGQSSLHGDKPRWRRYAALVLFALASGSISHAVADSTSIDPRLSILDNGVIRIGIDLNRGGSITYLADARTRENVVNIHDLGREIQQSYYSGPRPFGKGHHPGWKNWGWNPIGAGDVFGNPARVVKHTNDGKLLYVKTIPKQWALRNVDGECTFETWIKLEGTAARVRCRLVNNRADKTQYPAQHQELPVVYTIGKLHRLMTYDGLLPFQNKPMREINNAGPPWEYWKSTENWAALVNDQNWGLGVFHAGAYQFVGGCSGKRNTGGPNDPPTGYIAPLHTEIIDHNIVYEYEYALILGWLKDIRA